MRSNNNVLQSCISGAAHVRNCIANTAHSPVAHHLINQLTVTVEDNKKEEKVAHPPVHMLLSSISLQTHAEQGKQIIQQVRRIERRNSDDALIIGTDLLEEVANNISSFLSNDNMKFPITTNRISHLFETGQICQSEIFYFLTATRPVINAEIFPLLEQFLEIKMLYGSPQEKTVYNKMNPKQLVERLFQRRAVVFTGTDDKYLLKHGEEGSGGFADIGTEREKAPLTLENNLSYDEMKLGALICLSSPTAFINEGGKDNKGVPNDNLRSFTIRGIIIAVTPPRFDREMVMEYHDIVVDSNQNVTTNGFGITKRQQGAINAMWAEFYHLAFPAFPSYSDLVNGDDLSQNYIALSNGKYFNTAIYKARLQITAETIYLEANLRAAESNRLACVYVAGLGLNSWPFNSEPDKITMQQLYLSGFSMSLSKLELPHVGVVKFAGLDLISEADLKRIVIQPLRNKKIRIFLTDKNPQEKLPVQDDDMLLVVTYPSNCNSLPGNEYWLGSLEGDEQGAVCSSLAAELHNPFINPTLISGENAKIVHPQYDDI